MKPICLACSSPLQNAPFSLSIKLNDIFLPAPLCHVKYLQRCCRPTWVSRVCVLSEKETSEGRSKHWDIHISTPYCWRGPFLWEDSCFENVSGESSRAKGILDLKHGCFVYIWTSRPLQTDGKWQGNDSLWMAVFLPSECDWYCEQLYLYYRVQRVIRFFKVNLEQHTAHTHTPNGSSVCHKWLIRCSFFAWKDRVTLPLSLPSISVYLGV